MIWADVSLPSTEFQLLGLHLTPTEGVVIGGMVVALFVIAHVTDAVTKIRGLLCWAGGKVRARQMRKETQLRKAIGAVVEQKIAETAPPDAEERFAKLEQRIDRLEQQDAVSHDFRVYDESWHREDELERAEKGLPIKPRLTYFEYAAKWFTGLRYENGRWHKP